MREKLRSFWSPGVLITATVMLIAGWQLNVRSFSSTRSFISSDPNLRFEYPTVWLLAPYSSELPSRTGEVLAELIPVGTPQVRISVVSLAGLYGTSGDAFGVVFARNVTHQAAYEGYKRLGSKDVTVSGLVAHELEFAYVAFPGAPEEPPRVMRVKEVLIPTESKLLALSYTAPEKVFYEYEPFFADVLASTHIE